MRTSRELELATYVGDLIYTIVFVFNRLVSTSRVSEWLAPMVASNDRRSALLQEEPLYVAADFLQVDRFSKEFTSMEYKYLRFRREILSRSYPRDLTTFDIFVRSYINRPRLHAHNIHAEAGWDALEREMTSASHERMHAEVRPSRRFKIRGIGKDLQRDQRLRHQAPIRHVGFASRFADHQFGIKHSIENVTAGGSG
jgi:hypothetical protein